LRDSFPDAKDQLHYVATRAGFHHSMSSKPTGLRTKMVKGEEYIVKCIAETHSFSSEVIVFGSNHMI
jgi:hypothetical protein